MRLLNGYVWRLFTGESRRGDAAICKLLRLERRDDRAYSDDFLGTFSEVVKSPYYVPDDWSAVDRISPILDARFADFQATAFRKPPNLRLYEKAANLREARAIQPVRAKPAKQTADESLATDLVGLIDQPLANKQVRAVLTRAGLPIGKRIDEQANPAFGISYLGAKFSIKRKQQLGVEEVCFYAAKQTSFIRGIGRKVEFGEYRGTLPLGLSFKATRAAVRKILGPPEQIAESRDWWSLSKNRIVKCDFVRGKLAQVSIGRPDETFTPMR